MAVLVENKLKEKRCINETMPLCHHPLQMGVDAVYVVGGLDGLMNCGSLCEVHEEKG